MKNVYSLVKQMGVKEPTINRGTREGKRVYKLYRYLKNTRSPTKEGEAAILNCSPGGSVHQRTLQQLEFVLANNFSSLQPGEITSGNLADTSKYVWKLIAISRRQVYHQESEIVVSFLEEAFELAESAGLVLAAKTSSELLAILSAHLYFNEDKYLHYRQRADYFREVNLSLQRGIICFREISHRHHAGEEVEEVIRIARDGLDQLRHRSSGYHHASLVLLEYQFLIKISEIQDDSAAVIDFSTKALRFLDENDNAYPERRLAYYMYLGHAYLITNDYDNGAQLIEKLLQKMDPTSHNYGKITEIKVLLSLRTGHFEEAEIAFRELEKWISTYDKEEVFDQSAYLFGLYLHLIQLLVPPPYETERAWKNTRKLQSKDFRRTKIAVRHFHITGLLEQLSKQKYRAAKANWRSLPKPNKASGLRYKYFYSLLSVTFEQDLHRTAVERHAAKHLKKLNSRPLLGQETGSLAEIVPFEQLWKLLLEQLSNKRTKIR